MMRFDDFRGRRVALVLAGLVVALLAAFVPTASAQEVSAGITGVVTDPSGASIIGATVTATEASRGFEYTTETNAVGVYVFPRIPSGTYELAVESPGFRRYVQTGVVLEVNQRARIDINMQLGAVTEVVEVTGEAPLLNTETTIVGQTVDTVNLTETPLASRNFIELTLLTPGTTTTSLAGMRDSQRSGYSQSRPYVNGNRAQANNFLLDGIDNNQVSDNYTAYQPNVDAIQEVKMITNNASAEFGNFQGGIMNIIMKGGTNEYHGTAFEFFQNDKLNANNWARNWQDLDRPPVRLNTFGGTFGGPIVRDRLFFFANYQGIRRSEPPASNNFDVIPSAFRQGDFSALLGRGDDSIQLYDYMTTAADGTRQPFVNNQIPLSRIDPVASNLFSRTELYPQPLSPGLEFNQVNRQGTLLETDQGDVRVDYKPGVMDDISFRYSQGRQDVTSSTSQPLSFGSLNAAPFKAGVLNYTKTLGPTLVNEARFGVNRIILDNGGADFNGVGNVAEELGIVGANDRGPGLPSLQFPNGFANNLGATNIGTQALFANTTFHLADNMTYIRGRHTVKFGGQWLRQRMNTLYTGNTGRTGFITFDGRFTGATPTDIGFSEADFFLGAVSRTGRGVTNLWGHRKYILGFYVQDDWRATDKLTLNLGLRWEYHQPLYEVYDRQANFAPFTGALQLAGEGGNSRALYEPFKKDFQPRFGFAYSMTDRLVLRGAYTISSYMEGTGTNLRLPINPPFQIETEARYDDGTFAQPVISTGQAITAQANPSDPFRNANIRLWDPGVRPANTQQWSLIVENQISPDTMVSIGYIGQKGHHLVVPMPYFQRQLLSDGSTVASPYLSGNPALANISQISGTETNGNMQYHAMQLNMRRRMSEGLTYQIAYTYSKTMTDSLGFFGDVGQVGGPSAYWQYLYDRRAEWGPAFFDATHNATASFVYEMPFGRGRAYGGDWNSAVDGILGGWQLGGIVYLRSGFAMTVRGPDNSGTGSRGARADRVGDGTEGPRIVGPGGEWFDTSAYVNSAAGTLGNAGNGTFRGPRLFDTSLSLQKFFRITEGHQLQFRAEAFNITNTPAFQSLQRTVTSPTFGEVRGSQGERRFQLALKYIF